MPAPIAVVSCVELKLALRRLHLVLIPMPGPVLVWALGAVADTMPDEAVLEAVDNWQADAPVAGAHRRYADKLHDAIHALAEGRHVRGLVRELKLAAVEAAVGPPGPLTEAECPITGELVLPRDSAFDEAHRRVSGNFFSAYAQGVMAPCATAEEAQEWWLLCALTPDTRSAPRRGALECPEALADRHAVVRLWRVAGWGGGSEVLAWAAGAAYDNAE